MNNIFWKFIWYVVFFGFLLLFGYGYITGNAEEMSLFYIPFIVFFPLVLFSFRGRESSTAAKFWLISSIFIMLSVLAVGFVIENDDVSEYSIVNNDWLSSIVLLLFFALFPFMVYGFFRIFIGRPKKMKKLAHKYNLQYSRYPSSHRFFIWTEDSVKRNIIKGTIGTKKVYIYDLADKKKYLVGYDAITRRSTQVAIGGKAKEYRGKITGYCPLKQLDDLLRKAQL